MATAPDRLGEPATCRFRGSTCGNRHEHNHRLMCSDTSVIYMSRTPRNLPWQLWAMKSCCTRCAARDNWNYKQYRRAVLGEAAVIFIWLTDVYRKDLLYSWDMNIQGRKQSPGVSKQSRPWFNKQKRCRVRGTGNPDLCWFAAHAQLSHPRGSAWVTANQHEGSNEFLLSSEPEPNLFWKQQPQQRGRKQDAHHSAFCIAQEIKEETNAWWDDACFSLRKGIIARLLKVY